jgi:hypothetical protein
LHRGSGEAAAPVWRTDPVAEILVLVGDRSGLDRADQQPVFRPRDGVHEGDAAIALSLMGADPFFCHPAAIGMRNQGGGLGDRQIAGQELDARCIVQRERAQPDGKRGDAFWQQVRVGRWVFQSLKFPN